MLTKNPEPIHTQMLGIGMGKQLANDSQIKVATEPDVPDIMEIGLKCFPNKTLDQCFTESYLRLLIRLQDRSVLIAESEGKTVGFIVLHSHERDRIGNAVGWLLWLGVAERYRRKGHGMRLMCHAINELYSRSVSKVYYITKTREQNPAINYISDKLSSKPQAFDFLYAKMEVFEEWLNRWERLFPERTRFVVRGFIADDLQPVLKLMSKGIAFPAFEKLTSSFDALLFKHVIYPLEPDGIFVLEKEGNVIGFCQAQTFWENEDYGGKNGWIFNLVSSEKYVNRGAFTSLLKECKRYFKKRQVHCVSFWIPRKHRERNASLFQEFTAHDSMLWVKMLSR